MGPHLMKRPPKYVQGFMDRHGKARFYFRRAGFQSATLPGLPWSPQFMAVYEAALAGQPAPIGKDRVVPGTLRALSVSYFNSLGFRSMKPSNRSIATSLTGSARSTVTSAPRCCSASTS